MDFFSLLYSWLINLYGDDLDQFLYDTTDGMNYMTVGIVMLIISFVLPLLYYKVIDKPNWSHWWCWIIVFAINALLNFWWGWQPVLQNYYDDLMAVKDPKTGQLVTYVTETNCLMFGISTMILGILFFCFFSLICSRFSTNNADLTRAVDLMNKYSEIRKQLKFTEGAQSTFFKTEIEKILKNYTLPFQNIGDTSFESFIDISNLSIEDQAFTRMLFSEKNLSSKMDVGFKGNPNIGSVVLNQIFESDGFSDFANTFGQGDRIFIISSIFGGTGAAGFPMLLKTLRTSDWFNNSDVINKSNIGAVTILPYFKVSNDINQENEINSATFISKARSALAYYEKNISNNDTIDSLYFLADTPSKVYQYSVGGNTQKNDAHMIEFMAATAIVDFTFNIVDSIKEVGKIVAVSPVCNVSGGIIIRIMSNYIAIFTTIDQRPILPLFYYRISVSNVMRHIFTPLDFRFIIRFRFIFRCVKLFRKHFKCR